jgi:hypothetical protein
VPRQKTLPDNCSQHSVVIPDPVWRALGVIASVNDISTCELVRIALGELIQAECDASPLLAIAVERMCSEPAARIGATV